MQEIAGVAFPIPKCYMLRFFNEGKTVFVKPATIYKKLKVGMTFFFYQSHEDTGYVGEAIISQISKSEDPRSFFEIYGNNIFLTKPELKSYVETAKKWKHSRKGRKSKPNRGWLAIKLESIQKYDTPIKPKRFVPVGGKYIMGKFF